MLCYGRRPLSGALENKWLLPPAPNVASAPDEILEILPLVFLADGTSCHRGAFALNVTTDYFFSWYIVVAGFAVINFHFFSFRFLLYIKYAFFISFSQPLK